MPAGASQCPGLFARWPDYWTLNAVIGHLFGGTFGSGGSLTIDRYNRFYIAVTPLSLGEGLPLSGYPFSFNLSGGWLCETQPPERESLQTFLTGWAANANIGVGIGLGVVESGGRKAVEAGLYWPQVGGSVYHSWLIADLSALPYDKEPQYFEWDPSWGSPP